MIAEVWGISLQSWLKPIVLSAYTPLH